MCKDSFNTWICPITTWMCDEADLYCDTKPNSGGKFPCCVECFFCISPIAMVIDSLCFPKNIYQYYNREKDINVSVAI